MRWLIPLMLLLAGCTDPAVQEEAPPVERLEGVPEWQIGESWTFTGEEKGVRQVWTVMERSYTQDTHIIHMQLDWWYANGTKWATAHIAYNEYNLDALELHNPPFYDQMDCDDSGLFPMVSKNFTCIIYRNGEPRHLYTERTVGPVETVNTSIGAFEATKIVNFNPEMNDGAGRTGTINWWSDDVGQVIQFWEEGDLFVLREWHRP